MKRLYTYIALVILVLGVQSCFLTKKSCNCPKVKTAQLKNTSSKTV